MQTTAQAHSSARGQLWPLPTPTEPVCSSSCDLSCRGRVCTVAALFAQRAGGWQGGTMPHVRDPTAPLPRGARAQVTENPEGPAHLCGWLLPLPGETLHLTRTQSLLPDHRRSHTLATLTGTTPAAEIHTHQVAEPRKEKAIQRNALRATRDPSAARAPLSRSGCVQGLYYQRATKKSSHQAPSWTGLLVEAPQGHPYRRTQSVHYLRARRFSTMKWQTETNFYFKHLWLALSSPRQPAGSLTVV